MSVIEKLEQKLDRVIKSATEHARFSGTLAEELGAIESKLAGRIDAALNSVEARVEVGLAALKADLVGEFAEPSSEAADVLDRTVGSLRATANPATPEGPATTKADPGTGLPVLG